MTGAIAEKRSFLSPNAILGLSAALITLFLFYIDEGLYSFQWVREPGAWLVFLIYSVPIFMAQLAIYHLVLKAYKGGSKILISSFIGASIAITIVISILS